MAVTLGGGLNAGVVHAFQDGEVLRDCLPWLRAKSFGDCRIYVVFKNALTYETTSITRQQVRVAGFENNTVNIEDNSDK